MDLATRICKLVVVVVVVEICTWIQVVELGCGDLYMHMGAVMDGGDFLLDPVRVTLKLGLSLPHIQGTT